MTDQPPTDTPHTDQQRAREIAEQLWTGELPANHHVEQAISVAFAAVRAEQAATDAARIAELEDDVAEAEHAINWAPEEHRKAWEAIQASEGLQPNKYPSFQERVWWRAFKQRAEAAEARIERLEQAARDSQQMGMQAIDELSSARVRIEALRRYGQHEDGCPAWPAFPGHFTGASSVGACACGLTAALGASR